MLTLFVSFAFYSYIPFYYRITLNIYSGYNALKSIACKQYIRYLGIYIVNARQFKCRYDHATASFYRAFNAVFGKIGRSSPEEVVLQLINSKCMPCLLYTLEACPINKTQEKSLEFTINRVLMKIFRTVSLDVIRDCRLTVAWNNGHKGVSNCCQAQKGNF